jgi:hypothetical protein
MTDCAVNRRKTLIAIQGFPVLFRHLRGCMLVRNIHSYPSESLTWDALSPEGRPTLPVMPRRPC